LQEPVVFKVGEERLFGMLHLPESGGSFPAVLFCHGFTGHKIEAHALFVKAARALSKAGMAALRFDFRGSGESEGEFRDMTVTREIVDASAGLDVLDGDARMDSDRLAVLGLSLGGVVASCLAAKDSRLRSVALWSAVARPAALCQEPPRQAWGQLIRRHGHLDVGAHAVGEAFIEDLPKHDPVKALARTDVPVLVVHGEADTSVPVSAADLYFGALSERPAPAEKYIVPDADHTFTSLKWEAMAIEKTVDWFRRTLRETTPET